MPLKHIFVSHAGPDSAIAERIAGDLRNAGHDTKIDTKELTLGDDSIDFMNEGIANAHTVAILYSKHTEAAKWQNLEINGSLWNEVAQDGGTCIVIRLDDTKIPPILGPKVYGKLDFNDQVSYCKLLESLCKVNLQPESTALLLANAFNSTSSNPFRRLRAEYFEDSPNLHAKTFAPPDALMLGDLEDMKPCFLEGSRGTGKSMLLLSLRARNFLCRVAHPNNTAKVFGFYLKLSRGAICNAGMQSDPFCETSVWIQQNSMQVTDIAAQEIVVCILESLISEISFCVTQHLLTCDQHTEKALAESIDLTLFPKFTGRAASFDELHSRLMDAHRDIADYIRRRFIYDEQVTVPIATFDLEALKRVLRLVRRNVPALASSMFVILLDEYENLFAYQQRIVNGFVKLAPPDFSVKIAKKLGIVDTSGTTTGQELQETHDYTRLSLVYDVEDATQRKSYLDLLRHIVKNILQSEGLASGDVDTLIPKNTAAEVDENKLKAEVVDLCGVSESAFEAWPQAKQQEKMTYYREAAIYRVLYGAKGRHGEKSFSGFKELAFISSGVIRYFQEMLGVSYHLTYGSIAPGTNAIILPPRNQSRAVHFVSQHNLTTLSRNVETDGEALKYFLLDIGDCLRHKLLKHTSEPESARLTISDPECLDNSEMLPLRRLLQVGVREGVFQTKEGLPAFKPKHRSDPQPAEFNICRIYAPVLEISPRLRWRTEVKCSLLLGLTNPKQRPNAIKQLKANVVKMRIPDMQQTLNIENIL